METAPVRRAQCRHPVQGDIDPDQGPETEAEIRNLIRRINVGNSLVGVPRIHGDLLKPEIDVCQSTGKPCSGNPAGRKWMAGA